jgi:microcystin-dependent protein
MVNAQQTTGDVTQNSANGATQALNGTIRVIDNKGTIKYLQAKNGITTLTNTTNNVTTTTWQLGGTLTDDTTIDLNGKKFGLAKVLQNTNANQAGSNVPSTSATLGTSGYTILVRDEATGNVLKMLATDLVQSGQEKFTSAAGQTSYSLTGSPALPAYSQVWVYRNGAKLIANEDYTVSGSVVTLVPNNTAPNNWSVLAGDIIEVQYLK